MKTQNYQFDLMHQGLEYKDVIYNETILKIDTLLNSSVLDFIQKPPISLTYEEKYIIKEGEHINKICYFAHESKGVQLTSPHKNMIIYVIKAGSFYIFTNGEWQKLSVGNGESSQSVTSSSIAEQKFTGISDKFILPKKDTYHS